jgi:formylglycine-generating enzyme required for sulfatase activity
LLQLVGLGELRAAFSSTLAWQEWCQRALDWNLSDEIRDKIRLCHAVAPIGFDLDNDGCWRHVSSGMEMLFIAAGAFDMGSSSGDSHEHPVHRVQITRPFLMCKTPVTQSQYRAIVGHNPSSFRLGPEADFRPVECVSWDDAVSFCEAVSNATVSLDGVKYGFRLPTEAEWEYCCRAGTTTEWHTGSNLTGRDANFVDAHNKRTVAVGGYAANAWGLCDMHGNVWEWCLDAWDGSHNYPSSAVSDPYVSRGYFRVLRGGSWYDSAIGCRSSSRNFGDPGGMGNYIGFRVVLAPVLDQ